MPATKRLLIVSPHFPPANKPDHQRVRMSLPYYEEFGWNPHVLAVHPDTVAGPKDELLAASVPEHIPVTYVHGLSPSVTRWIGVGSLTFRSMWSFSRAANKVFASDRFDAVFFSTTEFTMTMLGRKWKRRYGVPYIMDFQDPWVNTYYSENKVTPPGGHLKYNTMNQLARLMEPRALREVSQIISVSAAYPRMLTQRYPFLKEDQFTVIPFGFSERDFDVAAELKSGNGIFDPEDGRLHLVYTGRGGEVMYPALRLLFKGLLVLLEEQPELRSRLRLHFVGTSYVSGAGAERSIDPIAQEAGVADMVEEITERVPYFQALRLMQDAHAVMLIGSNDAGYAASKLYPCLMARRPVLAIVHEKSPVIDALKRCGGGRAVPLGAPHSNASAVEALRWTLAQDPKSPPAVRHEELEKFSARELARQQCEVFNKAVSPAT